MRAEELHLLWFYPAKMGEFAESFGDFSDQRAAGHWDDYVVGEFPPELFGNFVAVGLGAFGVVGAQVYVDESPAKLVGDLGAEAVDVVVVAVNAHDARAVDGGVENFRRLEIRRDEDAGIESLLGALRGDGVRQVSGGGAANRVEPESACRGQGRGYHAILEGERGEADGIILEIEIFNAKLRA